MARLLRIEYQGSVYHITSRGNERKEVYRDAADRTLFLSLLQQIQAESLNQAFVEEGIRQADPLRSRRIGEGKA